MPSSQRDLAVGLFVLGGLLAIAYLSLQVAGLRFDSDGGFRLTATFDDIGGLTARSAVVISGVKVGRVEAITLDDDLRAKVALDLDPDLELPVDTVAAIRTSGLLGDQFVAIEPGAEEATLQSGDAVDFTQSAINLDRVIGAVIHQTGLGGSE